MRILLVEDEPHAAGMLAKGLHEHAYAVDVVSLGEDAGHHAAITDYDAVVLDVLLPGKSGLQVCRELRQSGSLVPILMLTARDTVESRIACFDSGADDYLVKSFDFGELEARLRAVIRRGRRPLTPTIIKVSGLALDTRARRASRQVRSDLVMGTHGLGGFRKSFRDSTAERLLRRTKVAVLAVSPVRAEFSHTQRNPKRCCPDVRTCSSCAAAGIVSVPRRYPLLAGLFIVPRCVHHEAWKHSSGRPRPQSLSLMTSLPCNVCSTGYQ